LQFPLAVTQYQRICCIGLVIAGVVAIAAASSPRNPALELTG